MISFRGMPSNAGVFAKIANLQKGFEGAMRKGLQQSGVQIAGLRGRANDGLIKQKMNEPKHGRTYIVGVGRKGKILKRFKLHQASRAGR